MEQIQKAFKTKQKPELEKTYLSTFITGFKEIAEDAVKNTFKKPQIELLLDGLITYKTETSIETVKGAPFFNNTFLLLREFKPKSKDPLVEMIDELQRSAGGKFDIKLPKRYRSFRVVVSQENEMVPIRKDVLEKIEKNIAFKSRLKVNRSKPNVEFWLLSRSEGYGFFGMRLTQSNEPPKFSPKGILRSELANLLIQMGNPTKEDVFLDPFAGYGSIPRERAKFENKAILVADNNPQVMSSLKKQLRSVPAKDVILSDIADLTDRVSPKSVDRIVSHPPSTNDKIKNLDLYTFYFDMLRVFSEVLKVDGNAVVLVASKSLFEKVVMDNPFGFSITAKIDTLVSGHKAAAYKLEFT